MVSTAKVKEMANFIWSVADLLRGDYKQADYGKVILPFTVLRRLDCVLEKTKQAVLDYYPEAKAMGIDNIDMLLNSKSGYNFHNISRFTFSALGGDTDNIGENLKNYVNGFSAAGREILEHFKFNEHLTRLDDAGLLFKVVEKFAGIDLHPDMVSNDMMGYVFEELIRKFAELSNETAGEHFTPREVIRLMVNVLFSEDGDVLTKPGINRTIYDPACGTGGMLSISEEYMKELNRDSKPRVFGQELNPESYAICKSDMLIKGQNIYNIILGNSFSSDGLPGKKFNYMLSNPPFGVEWRKVEKEVKKEHEDLGEAGRFGAGLPRISDGSFLFLQHMISKMDDKERSRIAIVFNGSPLFSGGAGSGESNIRKWIMERNMLEAIIALPDQLFYNTGIFTYIWIVTNRKLPNRQRKVQLVNAVSFYRKMSRSLGNKRKEISSEQIEAITRIYGDFAPDMDTDFCKSFDNDDFGYRRITVERPLRLNFQVSPDRVERVTEEAGFTGLAKSRKRGEAGEREIRDGRALQEAIRAVLRGMDGTVLYKNRDGFEAVLDGAMQKKGLVLKGPERKGVLNGLSERDETADICLDKKGNPVPDAQLRDYENVPLKEDIHDYFEREVRPHVPDAWIDESKTMTGYEINFTKYFYKYKPLRRLDEIRGDILALEKETEGMLAEVLDG